MPRGSGGGRLEAAAVRISNIKALGVATTSSITLATVPVSVQIVQAVCAAEAEQQHVSALAALMQICCTRPYSGV